MRGRREINFPMYICEKCTYKIRGAILVFTCTASPWGKDGGETGVCEAPSVVLLIETRRAEARIVSGEVARAIS